jgi:hypothetical protein
MMADKLFCDLEDMQYFHRHQKEGGIDMLPLILFLLEYLTAVLSLVINSTLVRLYFFSNPLMLLKLCKKISRNLNSVAIAYHICRGFHFQISYSIIFIW